jgi:hypothetical protein
MEKYRKVENIIDGELDNHQVIMHINNGKYFGLNPIGKRIWELIEEPKSIEEITAMLLSEYNILPDQCKVEVQEFMNKGVECEIIVKQ